VPSLSIRTSIYSDPGRRILLPPTLVAPVNSRNQSKPNHHGLVPLLKAKAHSFMENQTLGFGGA
jgi:hypothetical protein